MKVKVYRNLHKNCYSIVSLEGRTRGRVVDYKNEIVLLSPKFKVSEAGRQRVIKEKRKNVHAYVSGHFLPEYQDLDNWKNLLEEKVTYNPYVSGHFHSKNTNRVVHDAEIVLLCKEGVFI